MQKEILHDLHAIAESEERLKMALKVAGLGYFDWQFAAGKLHWDDKMCELHGLRADASIDKLEYLYSILHPEDRNWLPDRVADAIRPEQEVLAFGRDYRIELDGEIRYIQVKGSFFRDPSGAVQRVIGTAQDVTAKKQAEAQLGRIQRELRTLNERDVLKRRLGERLDEQSIEFLDLIGNSTHRMSKLIRALLDYSMVGVQEKMTEVDTHTLVRELIEGLATPINAAGARVEVEPLPVLLGYEAGLRVLFQNLISNAVKFRRHAVQPFVRISVRDDGDHWAFCVADNGIGIAKKHQHRIFGIFQRLHPTSEYSGTGIGLSHCRKIVELHGGQIWVESMPNVGSSFYFTLAR